VIADVAIHELRQLELALVATSSHKGTPFTEADFVTPFALVVGSEAHGVDPQLPIDRWVTIPHVGRAESLNVAMATTVVVFEAARQRGAQ
ncbi:MAG: TrmH family RNA methyltransferase, partial [Ilumatobacteraceae bacterium]